MKQLELHDDGRIVIRNRSSEWILERPTLGEYRRLVEVAEAADATFRKALDAIPEGPEHDEQQVKASYDLQFGTGKKPPLYGAVVKAFIETLAPGEAPDVDDLPSWAASGRSVTRMITHWRSVPLDLGPDGPVL